MTLFKLDTAADLIFFFTVSALTPSDAFVGAESSDPLCYSLLTWQKYTLYRLCSAFRQASKGEGHEEDSLGFGIKVVGAGFAITVNDDPNAFIEGNRSCVPSLFSA